MSVDNWEATARIVAVLAGVIFGSVAISAASWVWIKKQVFVGGRAHKGLPILMVALSFTLGIDLARHDPGLLRERMGSPVQRDQPAADKMLLIALLLFMFAWLALMGLDAKRFAWSSVPALMQVLGALITLWSIWFCYRAMRENSFAAPVIKLQQERGQRVISTGPYAFVRHPMYFGAAFYFIGTALLLGSWWGVISAFVLIGLLCIRIPIEEKALRAGLEGYDEYAAHVRYRLIPHVW